MNRGRTWFIATALMVLAGVSSAQNQVFRPDYLAQAAQRTIKLGAGLKQWAGLPRYRVALSNGFPAVPVKFGGYFSLAWDAKKLYVLGVFDQPRRTIAARNKPDTSQWWTDDAMEVYLRPDAADSSIPYLHYAVNPSGTRFRVQTSGDGFEVRSRIEAGRWMLELAFPLGSKNLPAVNAGTAWGLKIGREHQAAREFPVWPMGGDFSANSNFGFVLFNQKPEPASAAAARIRALGLVRVQGKAIKSRLSSIGSYAVYYGDKAADIEKLKAYDLAIVQPHSLQKNQIDRLHENGVRVIAYLTIGELDPESSFRNEVQPSWILGRNENWGSQYVDANQAGWRAIVLREAGRILEQGFDGLFLDTLDTVDLYPKTAPGMVSIVAQLRSSFPDKAIVQNRGFAVLPRTADLIDAVMFEDFSTTYDFSTKQYSATDGDPSEVLPYHARGLPVLAMEYALPTQQDLIVRAYARAHEFGFIPFVSSINLDTIFTVNP